MGGKILTSVVVLLVVIIISFSINLASSAMVKAQKNEVSIGKMEVYQVTIRDDVSEIKDDVKRILNKI